MANLIGILGVTHNPLLWSSLQSSVPENLQDVAANFERFRAVVSDLAPDVIVLVASDHFHMLMTSNMPAFMIGKAPMMRVGFPNEARQFGLSPSQVVGDLELAAHLLGGRDLAPGMDFSFSDEPWLDHSFLVPLLLLTPKLDVPVVPIFTNCNAPPIPTAARFVELGLHLRAAIDSAASDKRVLLIGSGHLALELGGPRQFLGTSPDPDFDRKAVSWMAEGILEEAVAATSFDRLTEAGNETCQFLNFITCLAMAGGRPATFAEGTPTRFGTVPFLLLADGMSRYLVNKLMWEVDRSDEAVQDFKADAGVFLDGWEAKALHPTPPYPEGGTLTIAERRAIENRDYGSLYAMGVNPFLLWQFARSISVPEEMGIEVLVTSFREAVEPHGYPDFFT